MNNAQLLLSGNRDKLLAMISRASKAFSIKTGTIIKAEVIELTKNGDAVLRLLSSGNKNNRAEQVTFKVSSEAPLKKGQHIYLDVRGDKNNLKMQLIDSKAAPMDGKPASSDTPQQFNSLQLLDLLTKLSESKLGRSEIKLLLHLIKSLPENFRSSMPELMALAKDLSGTKPVTIKALPERAQNLLTITGKLEKAIPVKAGSIVTAEVIEATKKGSVVLRLITPNKIGQPVQETIVRSNSPVPLFKGQTIPLEVIGEGKSIKMKIAANKTVNIAQSELFQQNVPVRFLDMLSNLSGSKLTSSEFKFFLNIIRTLPRSVKTAVPEFQSLEKLLLTAKELDGKLLRAFIESSGVALETKMRIAILNDPGSLFQNLFSLHAKGDLKAALLKLKISLKQEQIIKILKESGLNATRIFDMTEKFLNQIEFFQLSSRINEMFCTFLPLLWDGLKDGEIMFRKHRGKKNGSHTCDINLDIETIGKLSISVTMSNKAFYLSFNSERANVAELIRSQKHLLEKRFKSHGLVIKALNISQKEKIIFGQPKTYGANFKI